MEDVLKDGTLRSFEDLCKTYGLSKNTHYIFLQIRRALESYGSGVPWGEGSGVPWGEGSGRHPLHNRLITVDSKGLVSAIYRRCPNKTTYLHFGDFFYSLN